MLGKLRRMEPFGSAVRIKYVPAAYARAIEPGNPRALHPPSMTTGVGRSLRTCHRLELLWYGLRTTCSQPRKRGRGWRAN